MPNLRKLQLNKIKLTHVSDFSPSSLELHKLKTLEVIDFDGEGPTDAVFLPLFKALPKNVLTELRFNGSGNDDFILLEALLNQRRISKLNINVHGKEVPELSPLKLTSLILNTDVTNREISQAFPSTLRIVRSQPLLTDLNISSLCMIAEILLDIVLLDYLEFLDISINDIQEEFLETFNGMTLKHLTVRSHNQNSSEQLKVLCQIESKKLESLELDFPEIPRCYLLNFHKNNPNLKSIIVTVDSNCNDVINTIFTHFNNVEIVDILQASRTTNDNNVLCSYPSGACIKPKILTLFMNNIRFEPDINGFENLMTTMPNLEHLNLHGQIFYEFMIKSIAKNLPLLKTLVLKECKVTSILSLLVFICEHLKWLESAQLYGIQWNQDLSWPKKLIYRRAEFRSDDPVLCLVPI